MAIETVPNTNQVFESCEICVGFDLSDFDETVLPSEEIVETITPSVLAYFTEPYVEDYPSIVQDILAEIDGTLDTETAIEMPDIQIFEPMASYGQDADGKLKRYVSFAADTEHTYSKADVELFIAALLKEIGVFIPTSYTIEFTRAEISDNIFTKYKYLEMKEELNNVKKGLH